MLQGALRSQGTFPTKYQPEIGTRAVTDEIADGHSPNPGLPLRVLLYVSKGCKSCVCRGARSQQIGSRDRGKSCSRRNCAGAKYHAPRPRIVGSGTQRSCAGTALLITEFQGRIDFPTRGRGHRLVAGFIRSRIATILLRATSRRCLSSSNSERIFFSSLNSPCSAPEVFSSTDFNGGLYDSLPSLCHKVQRFHNHAFAASGRQSLPPFDSFLLFGLVT